MFLSKCPNSNKTFSSFSMLIGKEHNFLLIPVNTLILFSMKKVVKMVKYPSRKKKNSC